MLKVCDELDKAKDLHEYYKKRLTLHINNVINAALVGKEEEFLLREYIKEWKNYTILVHFMRKMFLYLDRYYLKNSNATLLATTALQLFREHCFDKVHERLKVAILNQMSRDRNNEMVDLELVKRAIYTFVEMGFLTADIVKQDDDYVWKGDKNNDAHYQAKLALPLIAKVRNILYLIELVR